ncbi:MAG: hypothetical protein ABGZ53_31320, partial [Fuerstiella sp.]
ETEIRIQDGLSSTVTYISSTGIGVAQKGRYRLDRVLGEGGFGRVYLGFDEELQRQVSSHSAQTLCSRRIDSGRRCLDQRRSRLANGGRVSS